VGGNMVVTAERYPIKGFEAPRPITSEAQDEYDTTVLHNLVMRGHLSRREEEYVEPLRHQVGARLGGKSKVGTRHHIRSGVFSELTRLQTAPQERAG